MRIRDRDQGSDYGRSKEPRRGLSFLSESTIYFRKQPCLRRAERWHLIKSDSEFPSPKLIIMEGSSRYLTKEGLPSKAIPSRPVRFVEGICDGGRSCVLPSNLLDSYPCGPSSSEAHLPSFWRSTSYSTSKVVVPITHQRIKDISKAGRLLFYRPGQNSSTYGSMTRACPERAFYKTDICDVLEPIKWSARRIDRVQPATFKLGKGGKDA